MKDYLIIVIAILFLSACTSYSGPKNDVNISTTTELKQLFGTYKNSGDPNGRLSVFIWGSAPINSELYRTFLKHDKIKYINVISNEKSILVRAIAESCIAYEKEYILGDDFDIDDGKIILSQESQALSRGAGDPLVGPSSNTVTLSLDTDGHGIYKNETYAAGLIYLLIPVAISNIQEIRFTKLNNDKSYSTCYKR